MATTTYLATTHDAKHKVLSVTAVEAKRDIEAILKVLKRLDEQDDRLVRSVTVAKAERIVMTMQLSGRKD